MDWPNEFIPYRWQFGLEPNTRTFSSPVTRTRQVLQGQGPRYRGTASFRFPSRTTAGRRKAQRFEAFVDTLKGQVVTVNVWDFAVCGGVPLGPNLDGESIPDTFFTDGTGFADDNSPPGITIFDGGTGDIVVWTDWGIGAESVGARGFPANTVQLYAGDQVQIGNFLYRLTADVSSDGMGRATLALNRPLITAASDGDVIVRTRARTPMQLIDDQQAFRSVDIGGVREYSISLVEAFF